MTNAEYAAMYWADAPKDEREDAIEIGRRLDALEPVRYPTLVSKKKDT